MSQRCHPGCENKGSFHYCMWHMTQDEFQHIHKGIQVPPYEFNELRGRVSQRSPIAKSVTFEKDS